LFTISGNGENAIITLGPNQKILPINDMNEKVFATPAIVDGVIYARTHKNLYAFGDHNGVEYKFNLLNK